MVVRTHSNGRDNFGLRVGAANARRYFPRTINAVELRLDDLHIRCHLPETFWNGQPEIFDPRLCEWLKFKVLRERRNGEPIPLQMVQSGTNSFTLKPSSAPHRQPHRTIPVA
ncbi:hypothetical protein [Occallatibacter riparius]|uniref:Uncharacterized protein n=1 Tax=Occallatibacter riparius TaxID=1002689 RepID=A0A9J7BYL5_9BACT|nr:hypothetical protein [Occallatibacter riparius]UWZ86406.1 hypothetical protein MOP44_10785 [Occallatibacter riparius]